MRATIDPPAGLVLAHVRPIEDVPVGGETTRCVILRLGNTEQLRVGSIHNVLSEGSHHFIVYRTNETVERPEPFECEPFVDTLDPSAGSPLMITQRREERLQLSPGVAFTLEPDQMIRLEMHYLNYTEAPLDITATATFEPIAPGDFMYEADFLFIGNPDVDIAARSTETLGPTFFRLPTEFEGANFFGITGHTHQWGTDMTVDTAASASGATALALGRARDRLSRPAVPGACGRGLPLHLRVEQPLRRARDLRRVGQPRDVLLLGLLLPEPRRLRLRSHRCGLATRLARDLRPRSVAAS